MMRSRRRPSLLRLLGAAGLLCISACSLDSDVVVSVPEETCHVYGQVRPSPAATTVRLLRNGSVLSTAVAESSSGAFFFADVPFGVYRLEAVAGEWRGAEELRIFDRNDGRVYITMYWSSFAEISAFPGAVFTPKAIDPTIAVSLKITPLPPFRTETFLIEPSSARNGAATRTEGSGVSVRFDADSLFHGDTLVVRAVFTKSGVAGDTVWDTTSLGYGVDSAGLGRRITDILLGEVSVGTSHGTRDLDDGDTARDVSPEPVLALRFSRPMDRASVERCITSVPPMRLNPFWNSSWLTLESANTLEPQTLYTVTIAAGALTADSLELRAPTTVRLLTYDYTLFSSFWPLDGSEQVALTVPFRFSSYFPLEPALLQQALSCTPAVDSFAFELSADSRTISVNHAALLADTAYTIVVDSSLTSRKGAVLGHDLTISFRTRSE